MKTYRAVKRRKSDFPNPITVQKGEKVLCIQESNQEDGWEGWILCRTKDNEGWIPHQIVEVAGKAGVIVEDYCAEEFDLDLGDILVSEKEMNGWIWCHKEGYPDKRAWAPLDHLEPT